MTFNKSSHARSKWLGRYIPAGLGIVISLCLHFYFLNNWPRYVRSIPSSRLAQRGGRPPNPHLVSSPLSVMHGAICLLLLGAIIPLLTRDKYWGAGVAYASAVGLSHVALITISSGMGNLWPIVWFFVFVITAVPALAGASVTLFFVGKLNEEVSRG